MAISDEQMIHGLTNGDPQRRYYEKELYIQYEYLIHEGSRKYHLTYDDSFSAYSDTIVSVINNIIRSSFDHRSSIKTYLIQIFSNKCIDLVRKKTTNKEKVHHGTAEPELLGYLPDKTKSIVEKLVDQQKIQAVKQHLETMGEKCREILLLFEDGYTDREIAEQLQYNSAAVAKTTRLRCLDKIKEKMKHLFTQHE